MVSLLAGILRADDHVELTTIAPNTVVSAVDTALATYTAERNTALSVWVDSETTNRQERVAFEYIELGQELGIDGRPLEARGAGSADVAFMWKRYGWATGWNVEDFARLTVADLSRKTTAITAGNARTHTVAILQAVFGGDGANYTYKDRDGDLTIRRLANGDGQLYPFPDGTEGTANHYTVTGFTSAQMSATNNPFEAPAVELRRWFGSANPVVAFINSAQRKDVQTLIPNFVDAPTRGITPAAADPSASPVGVNVPGTFIGVDGDTGVYVYVWDRIPADYMQTVSIGAPAPLKRRVPPEAVLQGFRVEAEETHNPFYGRMWRERFGYAVANRLSMVVTQFKASGTYTTPTIFQ